MAQRSLRRWLLAMHLYIGIAVGGIFSLMGLTGSALVFYPEIDRILNPALVINNTTPTEIRYQVVFERLRHHFPQRQGAWRIEAPRTPDQPIFARYLKPEEKDPGRFVPLVVALDPQTLEIIQSRFWGDDLMTWIYDLHYSLLMGSAGKLLVSALGVVFLLTLFAGVYLWLPRGRDKLSKALPKMRAGSVKAVYDLHGYSGAYGALLLVVLIITGIGLATPQWVSPLVAQFSRQWSAPPLESGLPEAGAVRIGADRAISVARSKFPTAELRWIQAPVSVSDVYYLRLKQAAEPGSRFPKTYVWVDQFSAEVTAFRDPLEGSAADVFFDWLHPLHNGEAFGWLGRWLVLMTGVIPLLLFITGLLRWRQKIKARRRT